MTTPIIWETARVQIPVIRRHFQHKSLDSSPSHVKTMCSSCGCKSAEGVKKNCGCGQDPCKTFGAETFETIIEKIDEEYSESGITADATDIYYELIKRHGADKKNQIKRDLEAFYQTDLELETETFNDMDKVKHQHYKDMIALLESQNDLSEMDKVKLHHYKDMLKMNAETFEDSWEKGVIRLAISSGCFSDEYAEWVERQIDGPSSTLNNPRYKKIIDKRWGLSAETFEAERIHGVERLDRWVEKHYGEEYDWRVLTDDYVFEDYDPYDILEDFIVLDDDGNEHKGLIIIHREEYDAETFEAQGKRNSIKTVKKKGITLVKGKLHTIEEGGQYDKAPSTIKFELPLDEFIRRLQGSSMVNYTGYITKEYDAEYHRDSKGRFAEKPLLTGSVIGGLALGLMYFMGRK